MRFLGLALLALAGCSSRFASLQSGTYACEAKPTANDCGVALSTESKSVKLIGGGSDIVDIDGPSDGVITGDVVWEDMQFGAQSDPMTYKVDGSVACANGEYGFHQVDDLETVGDDHLVVGISLAYANLHVCGFPGVTSDSCKITFQETCDMR